VSIKLVVSGSSKESRIALVGRTGKELLASATFTEPRAKGATLRALKQILGADVDIEDATTTSRQPSPRVTAVKTVAGKTATAGAKPPSKKTTAAGETPSATKKTERTAHSLQPA
jgi:hypothetical protein